MRHFVRPSSISPAMLLAVLLFAATLLPGCPAHNGAGKTNGGHSKEPPAARAVTVVYIGNLRGFQRPCHCDQKQDGGLLRLASVLRHLRGEEVALPDPAAVDSQTEESAGTPIDASPPADSSPPADASPPVDQGPEVAPSGGHAVQIPIGPVKVDVPPGASLDPLWLVDCGNFADVENRLPGFRAHTHLKALALMRASAAVLGSAEAALSAPDAESAFSDCPLPLVSCNLSSSLPNIKVRPSFELGPGWYLVGVTPPLAAGGPGASSGGLALRRKLGGHKDVREAEAWASVSDPVAGLKTTLAQLPADAKVIVASADLPAGLLEQLKACGEPNKARIMALIGGQRPADDEAALVNTSPLPAIAPAPMRRVLKAGFVSINLGDGNGGEPGISDKATLWEYRLHMGLPDDPEMDSLLKADEDESLKVALSSGEWRNNNWSQNDSFLPPSERKAGSITEGYVGSSSCQSCHPNEYKTWEGSGHAHAFETLIKHDNGSTLDCLECHVVGMLEPGGFLPQSAQPALAAVGCESCHGPGGEHVGLAAQLPGDLVQPEHIASAGLPKMGRTGIGRGNVNDCLYCHDDFNSPRFKLEDYWPRIKH